MFNHYDNEYVRKMIDAASFTKWLEKPWLIFIVIPGTMAVFLAAISALPVARSSAPAGILLVMAIVGWVIGLVGAIVIHILYKLRLRRIGAPETWSEREIEIATIGIKLPDAARFFVPAFICLLLGFGLLAALIATENGGPGSIKAQAAAANAMSLSDGRTRVDGRMHEISSNPRSSGITDISLRYTWTINDVEYENTKIRANARNAFPDELAQRFINAHPAGGTVDVWVLPDKPGNGLIHFKDPDLHPNGTLKETDQSMSSGRKSLRTVVLIAAGLIMVGLGFATVGVIGVKRERARNNAAMNGADHVSMQ